MAQCLCPISIPVKDKYLTIDGNKSYNVPCGRCPECQSNRIMEWVFRLQKEMGRSVNPVFLTLTYSDEHLTFTEEGLPTLVTKDHVDFMKRLRQHANRKLKSDLPLRYYACGEYGSLTERPHYHSILFNLPDEMAYSHWDRDENRIVAPYLEHVWKNGAVHIGSVTSGAMAYVAGYMQKRLHPHRDGYQNREPEKSYVSKGIGENYLTPARKTFYKKRLDPYFKVEGGQIIRMPRYYKNKIYEQIDEFDQSKWHMKTLAKKFALENPRFIDEKHHMDFAVFKFHRSFKLSQQKRIKL